MYACMALALLLISSFEALLSRCFAILNPDTDSRNMGCVILTAISGFLKNEPDYDCAAPRQTMTHISEEEERSFPGEIRHHLTSTTVRDKTFPTWREKEQLSSFSQEEPELSRGPP